MFRADKSPDDLYDLYDLRADIAGSWSRDNLYDVRHVFVGWVCVLQILRSSSEHGSSSDIQILYHKVVVCATCATLLCFFLHAVLYLVLRCASVNIVDLLRAVCVFGNLNSCLVPGYLRPGVF